MSCLIHILNRTYLQFSYKYGIQIPDPINFYHNNRLFIAACDCGDTEMVKKLIEKGVNNWDEGFKTACRESRLDIVQILIMGRVCDLEFGMLISYLRNNVELRELLMKNELNWNHCLMLSILAGRIGLALLSIEKGETNINYALELCCRDYESSISPVIGSFFYISMANLLLLNGGQVYSVPNLIKSNLGMYRLNGVIDPVIYESLVIEQCPIYCFIIHRKKSTLKKIPIELIKLIYSFNVIWRK